MLLGPPSKTYSEKLGWLLRTGVWRFATFLDECLVLFLLVLLKTRPWCANKTIFAPEYFCGAAPSWRRLHFFRKIKMLYYKNTNFRPRSLPRDSKMVKISPQRPPGDPQMAKMESQRAPNDVHDHPKDPPRAPKGSTRRPRGPPSLSSERFWVPRGPCGAFKILTFSLRKSVVFEFGPGAVRRRPQTRSLTPERDPAGPKLAKWRQGPPPGGKSF